MKTKVVKVMKGFRIPVETAERIKVLAERWKKSDAEVIALVIAVTPDNGVFEPQPDPRPAPEIEVLPEKITPEVIAQAQEKIDEIRRAKITVKAGYIPASRSAGLCFGDPADPLAPRQAVLGNRKGAEPV